MAILKNEKTDFLMILARLCRFKAYNESDTIRVKQLFLFWLLNMSIICENVHRLELWKYFQFWVAVAK